MIQIKMYDALGEETSLQPKDVIDLWIRKDKHKGAVSTLYISVIRDGKKLKVGRSKKDEVFIMGVSNVYMGSSMMRDLLSQSTVKGCRSSGMSKKHRAITITQVF